jgi:hypothetical protein
MIKDVLGSPGFKHFFSLNNLMFVFSYFNYILLHRQECHIPVIQAHSATGGVRKTDMFEI